MNEQWRPVIGYEGRYEGMEGCHNDGNPANNRLSNLRWDTHVENMRDAQRQGRMGRPRTEWCPQGHHKDGMNSRGPFCIECARTAGREFRRRQRGVA